MCSMKYIPVACAKWDVLHRHLRFITGSYDRTCKVWKTTTGDELLTLEGHKNVVYAIAFNNPYGDKIVTGSFDKTAKVILISYQHAIDNST